MNEYPRYNWSCQGMANFCKGTFLEQELVPLGLCLNCGICIYKWPKSTCVVMEWMYLMGLARDNAAINHFEALFRSLEDINTVLEFAKLEKKDVKPVVQSVFFSPELDNESYKLLEVDESVLDSILSGKQVVIRGDEEDSAVLCTDDKTYDIKEADISNAMLIIPDLKVGKDLSNVGEQNAHITQVTSVMHNYYELRPCKPKVKKLKSLLEENKFSGMESENDESHQGQKYTFQDLLNLVQASEIEIKTALDKLQACHIEGHWRVLDFDFLSQVLNHIMRLCEENDWLTSGIPLEDCCQTLEELFPRSVLEHVVHCYGDSIKPANKTDEEEEQMEIDRITHRYVVDTKFYNLNEDKICRFFAELVLRHAGKFNFQEFLKVWEQTVPSEMKTSLHQLEGMALIDRNCKPEVIWYFPSENLPEDVGERFNFLFKTQEKWTLEEIKPYISDLTTEKMDVGALLTKYARASLQNGIKVFNSRKPVT
ncbi:hypothetical protein FSP39_024775 [Pinctada imbricata]|uniref:Sister chromatid cohesion protein DCC1 n=1 Tax=Pinctada imbricata TaxID=66713 RepID=A0AA89C2K0_PINIB|nr:hypothetical protein FSP39_024775 [Pinctada imbricata]